MATHITTYIGELRLFAGSGYTKNALEFRQVDLAPGTFKVKVQYCLDDTGQLRLNYFINDDAFMTFWRDDQVFVERNGTENFATFRPPEETRGVPMLGFILPPEHGDLFYRQGKAAQPALGEPCPSQEPGCTTVVIPIHAGGVMKNAQWRADQRELEIIYQGGPMATWRFTVNREGLPTKIQFSEQSNTGAVTAEATYQLANQETTLTNLTRAEVTPDGIRIEVLKDGAGYGGEYKVAQPNVWKHYQAQERIWSEVDQANTLPLVWIGTGFLALMTLAIGGLVLWKRFHTPKRPMP